MNALLVFLCLTSLLFPTVYVWEGDTDMDWFENSNWDPVGVPTTTSDTASFTSTTPATTTIELTSGADLKSLLLDYSSGYTISPSVAQSIDFANISTLSVTNAIGNGAHTISTPITIGLGGITITQQSSGDLTLSGNLIGGALAMNGPQVLVLSDNTNDFSQTTINGGTISVSGDGALGINGAQLILNNGTLLYSASFTHSRTISAMGTAGLSAASGVSATVNGVISGSGSLTTGVSGGTIILGGTNTYSGGTNVSSGTLQISSDSNLGDSSAQLHLINGTLSISSGISTSRSGSITGTATISSSATNTFSGDFSGGGSLTVSGGGLLILRGNNDYTGPTTIANATHLQGTSSSISGNITLNTASSFLIFDQDFDGTFDKTFSSAVASAGVLQKIGTGNLTISADSSSFSGAIQANSGTLTLQGSLSQASATVASGATLAGSGGAGTTTLSGTLSPGTADAIGTFTITGNLTANSASTLAFKLSPLLNDAISVSGTAALNGVNLILSPQAGLYNFSTSYTLLSSSTLSSATISSTSIPSPFQVLVSSTGTSLIVTVLIGKPFSMLAFSNENTKAVGDNFDTLFGAGQISSDILSIVALLVGQSTEAINQALDQMHPAPYSALIIQQAQVGAKLLSLCHKGPSIPCFCSDKNRFWLEPFGASLSVQSAGFQTGFQGNSGGVCFGYDREISPEWTLGIASAWNRSNFRWHQSRGNGHIIGLFAGPYSDWRFGNLALSANLLLGKDFYQTQRKIAFSNIKRTAKAEFHALDILAGYRSAYLFGSPAAFFYPYANFDYLYFRTESFEEKKAQGLSLQVGKRGDGILRSELGIGAKVQDHNEKRTGCLSPEVRLAYVNMSPLQKPKYEAHFTGTRIPFYIRGWDKVWNLFEAYFALHFSFKCVTCKLDYSLEIYPKSKSRFYNQEGSFRLDWKW